MKTATLAWLVVLLFSAGTSGTTLSEDDSSVRERANARVLMDVMQSECLNRTAHYSGTQSFHFYLATMFNPKLMKSLYETAIRQLLEHQPYEAVASYVWNIHQDDGVATFFLMVDMLRFVNAYLGFHVDWFKYAQSFKYHTDLAYYMYRISNSELFAYLRPDVEYIIKNLRKELRLIFFSPQFCLKNQRLNEYLSLSFVGGRRQIITAPFRNRTLSAPFIWRKKVTDALVGGVAIKGRANFAVSLHSNPYGNYIYLDRTRANRVFDSFVYVRPVDEYLWRMHYVSSTVMFEQHGLYLCATDELDNEEKEGHLVAGMEVPEWESLEWKCQWTVERCDESGE